MLYELLEILTLLFHSFISSVLLSLTLGNYTCLGLREKICLLEPHFVSFSIEYNGFLANWVLLQHPQWERWSRQSREKGGIYPQSKKYFVNLSFSSQLTE